MTIKKNCNLLFFALFLSTLLVKAANQETSSRPLQHEVTVRLVLVDLSATNKDGRFITHLTKDDFEIFDDGKKVSIQSADLIRLKKPEAEGAPQESVTPSSSQARDNRFFVVFDSINTIKRILDRNRSKIVEKLVSLVQIGQQIMVLELAESGEVKVLQSLTQEKDLIAGAVDRASGSIWVEKAADTLAVPSILTQQQLEASPFGPPPGGNKFEKTNRDIYEHETRQRFEKTINSLLAVLNTIKDYPGRKSILYISGGIPSVSFGSFLSGQGGTIEDTTVIQSQVATAKILDPFKSLRKKGFQSGQDILEDLAQFANSNNISFYALDPDNYLRFVLEDMAYDNFPRAAYTLSGTRSAGIYKEDEIAEIKKTELSGLQNLTRNTGGVSFLGADKFDEFSKVINRDLSYYYELSYSPLRKEADGKYHTINVRITKPDINIRFRQGYVDYTDAQKESLIFASAAYNPSLFKDIPFEAQVIPFVISNNKFSLWIQMALPMKNLVAKDAGKEKPIPLKFKIVVDDFSQGQGYLSEVALPLVLSPSFLQKNKNAEYVGFSCCSQELELSKEKYRVNIAMYHEGLGQMGTVERVLAVPGLKNSPEARVVNAVLGNLIKTEESTALPFSISAKDGTLDLPGYKFYPMAANNLEKTKITSAFLQVYSPNQGVTYQADFSLFQDERPVSALSFKPVSSAWNKRASVWNLLYAFALGDFPGGDYRLKIELVDPAGTRRIETILPIKIL